MGLQDRDYYHEKRDELLGRSPPRRETAFARQMRARAGRPRRSWPWMHVLFWAVVMLAVFAFMKRFIGH